MPTPFPINTLVPTVVEPGLAYGLPCDPPCWRDLVPGQSTSQEAATAMERLRTSGWARYVEGESTDGYYIEPGSIFVRINQGIVTGIHGQITFYYPVGTMVQQFGEPAGMVVAGGQSTPVLRSCEEWSPPNPPNAPVQSFPASILYPDHGNRTLVTETLMQPAQTITVTQVYTISASTDGTTGCWDPARSVWRPHLMQQ